MSEPTKEIKRGDVITYYPWHGTESEITVRVMAVAEGYAMVRRKGAVPFVEFVKYLQSHLVEKGGQT